ncbi:MAG: phosphatase PAP2 family protein [Chitinophagaceae bacterium]|nr:MAG: phosphatase PAP2 family protein [Chitinophagaceae bacterium]
MKKLSLFLLFLSSCLTVFSTDPNDWKKTTADPDFIHRAIKEMTDVIVYDIYSPPVASRTYAYISIGGYEAMVPGSKGMISLAGQVKGLPALPQAPTTEISNMISAVEAILVIGKSMVISEKTVEAFRTQILAELKSSGIPLETYNNSIAWGDKVAAHIIAWAAKDNYKQTRGMDRYALNDNESSWKPTPPAYMKAIEPHWSKMRVWVMDSAKQFKPLPALAFAKTKNSPFYKEANKVYIAGKALTAEQTEIAMFWDCNPFKMNVNGHVMFATKKISPGGHWINITRLACKQSNADYSTALEAYARISMVLADAFISCWDEKYRSNVIRPETYINQYIDPNWIPLLQTPPFPEYTSGHSVVSNAAQVVLTKQFGENFKYQDSTEIEFGLPVRSFTSFKHAAQEAAISRFYGGIHYMPAIDNGMVEGEKIGKHLVSKLRTREN